MFCQEFLLNRSTFCENPKKVKSCPRPTKKQNHVHNPPKSNSSTTTLAHTATTTCSRRHKKGIPAPLSVMTQEHRNPLNQGFSSPLLCISCQQNYSLDVFRLN